MRRVTRIVAALVLAIVGVLRAPPVVAQPSAPPRAAEAVGTGGAVSSVDPDASAVGIEVLRRGGNAVDAAVATAAALGVTDPYSAGVGGGGFFVVYDAATAAVSTIDGRETAPASADEGLFLENGEPIPFDEAVTSGLSVGVPGTPLTWQRALDEWGTLELREALRPAEQLARRGFVVDETFAAQTSDNAERFADFPATRALFLPGGAPPEVGELFRNPDLARTYRELGRRGVDALYQGEIGHDVVRTVRQPPVDPAATRTVRPGAMTTADLAGYTAALREPTAISYRGLDVYGMAPPSSGGTTIREALNILEGTDLAAAGAAGYLHRFLEASKLSFADRNRYVGDPAFSDVPTTELLSPEFADSRACLIRPDAALPAPQPGRLARRRDDHHHRAAGAHRPPRPRDVPARRDRRGPCLAAQRGRHRGGARVPGYPPNGGAGGTGAHLHRDRGDRCRRRCAAAARRPLARRRRAGPPRRGVGHGGAAGRVTIAAGRPTWMRVTRKSSMLTSDAHRRSVNCRSSQLASGEFDAELLRGSRMPAKVGAMIKLLEARGWYLAATRGSHRQFKHPHLPGRVTVPGKLSDTLHPRTEKSILRQARI